MVNNFLFCVCVCVLQVTWRANGIVLYMYEGNVLMDPLRKGKGLNDRNKSEIDVYFPVVQEPIRNTKIIYIPWPFPQFRG